MARLFYDEVRMPATFNVPKDARRMELEGQGNGAKIYLEKISKLIPSEVLAGYLTLVGLVAAIHHPELHSSFYYGSFLLCLVLTPLYLNYQAEGNKPKLTHLIISTVAFMVWAYAMSGDKVFTRFYDPAAASAVLVVFTLVSGVVPLKK
jgi:hypothetical protein